LQVGYEKNNVYGWVFFGLKAASVVSRKINNTMKKKHGRSKQSFFPETTSTTIKKIFFREAKCLEPQGPMHALVG